MNMKMKMDVCNMKAFPYNKNSPERKFSLCPPWNRVHLGTTGEAMTIFCFNYFLWYVLFVNISLGVNIHFHYTYTYLLLLFGFYSIITIMIITIIISVKQQRNLYLVREWTFLLFSCLE